FAVGLHEGSQFSLSLRGSYAGLGTPKQIEIVRAAVAGLRWIKLQCGPDLRGILFARRELKAFGHDPDDGGLGAIEESFAANDGRIGAEDGLPCTVRDVENLSRSGNIIGLRDHTSLQRSHAD